MNDNEDLAPADLERLVRLVRRLRAPDGCPWDRSQGLGDLRAYLIEEAHEAATAIDSGDWGEIGEEIGDLLFQAAFILELAGEAGALGAGDVVDAIEAKMVARHPHVFGGSRLETAAQVAQRWERRKLAEDGAAGTLSGVPASLPALVAAYRMGQKAAGVGFDWSAVPSVLAKLDEEVEELKEAHGAPATDPGRADRLREEVGDVLFTVANVARHLEIDPEAALAAANRKFRRRFEAVERAIAQRGEKLAEVPSERLEEVWQEIKSAEPDA